jgi:hypothetical protein
MGYCRNSNVVCVQVDAIQSENASLRAELDELKVFSTRCTFP